MNDLVRDLLPTARVLDLGAGGGSFDYSSTRATVLAVDVGFPPETQPAWARLVGRSESLPLRSGSTDVVICNHTLEHFEKLEQSLREIDRILKIGGFLWAAVPDATTLDDRLYRFLFTGGGHVNPFTLESLIQRVEACTRLKALRFKKLFSGFVFLKPPEVHKLRYYPRRIRTLCLLPPRGQEMLVRWLNWSTRTWDRLFKTNTSQYGWGVVFQASPGNSALVSLLELPSYTNVCWHCGCGHPAESLIPILKKWLLWKVYDCPPCGRRNIYSRPL